MSEHTLEKCYMDHDFALFNSHINHAGDRAMKAFKVRFGEEVWGSEILPYVKDGIMSIFNNPPNEYTRWYVEAVWLFVNGF